MPIAVVIPWPTSARGTCTTTRFAAVISILRRYAVGKRGEGQGVGEVDDVGDAGRRGRGRAEGPAMSSIAFTTTVSIGAATT